MTYRMIALDLDGTLLNRAKMISPGNMAALQAARAADVAVVVATGRTVGSAREIASRIGPDVPVIACNGAIAFDEKGEVLAQKIIAPALALQMVQRLVGTGCDVLVQTAHGVWMQSPTRLAGGYWRFVRQGLGLSLWESLRRLRYYWRVNRFHVVRSLPKWLEKRPVPVLKVECSRWGQDLTELFTALAAEFPQLTVTKSGRDIVEVMAGGVNKGWALERLAAAYKVPAPAIVAMGDAWNDIEMLRYAGLGIAMGGAPADVRAAAKAETCTCDEDGVAAAIHRYVLTDKQSFPN